MLSSILSKNKTELFDGRSSTSPDSLQGGKLTTDPLYQTNTELFSQKLCEKQSQNPVLQCKSPWCQPGLRMKPTSEPPLPDPAHRCSRSLPRDKGRERKCIVSVGTLPKCIYPRELNHRAGGNSISQLGELNFPFHGFFFITLIFFCTWNANSWVGFFFIPKTKFKKFGNFEIF